MNTLMNIPFEFCNKSLYDVQEVNSSFAVGKLKVMYTGNNRNGSHFSKKSVENALPSLYNVPIVCHWNEETQEIGGHDISIASSEDGNLRIINLTEPCGVVPDHAKFTFQNEADEDGNEHEYLIIDGVILWKRQDVCRHIIENLDGKVKHSMEIKVIEMDETKDNHLDIKEFEFTALCLLGDCEPCFQGSELELFSVQNFKQKMNQMILEMKESFPVIVPSNEDDNKQLSDYSMKGGNAKLKDKSNIITKDGLDTENLLGKQETQNNFELEGNFREELYRALDKEKSQRDWGEISRYLFVDYDKDACEIYCWDSEDWLLYGFTYSVSGDAIKINFDSKKRKKYEIVDFDEGEQSSPFADTYAILEEKIRNCAELEEKFQNASDTIKNMETELNELKQFKNDVNEAAAKAEKEQVLTQFSDLSGLESFEALKANIQDYNADDLEEKCFAIRGRTIAAKNRNNQLFTKAPKLKIEKESAENEPYGGLFAQYGIISH